MIKIGIIGCGGIANNKHMPALAKVEAVEMVRSVTLSRNGQAKQERNLEQMLRTSTQTTKSF